MAEVTHDFDASAEYDLFMGRWSRAAGIAFLDWLAPPKNARWLDVGCGTGVFTELVLESCAPAQVVAIDPSQSQIEHARRQLIAQTATFRIANAEALPFPDCSFDVVASALVLNFIPGPMRALHEMRRVARPGGLIAAYVWDFETELSPSWPLRVGMRKLGLTVPEIPGTNVSGLASVRELFARVHLEDIVTTSVDANVSFSNFDELWRTQTTRYSPTTRAIETMAKNDREQLKIVVQELLGSRTSRSPTFRARANAIKCRAPG